MSNFQIILIAVFIAFVIFGVMIFSGFIPIGQGGATQISGQITVWGTIPTRDINEFIGNFKSVNRNIAVNYVAKSAANFDEELVAALAAGTGPDVFLLDSDFVFKNRDKIFEIPYLNFPIKTYKDNFISASEIYLTNTGVLALPLYVDPIVMYYNRTLFNNAGIPRPPTAWDEFPNLAPQLTSRSNNRIIKSAVGMGGSGNIEHAKEIISALVLQAGNPIVRREEDTFEAVLSSSAVSNALSFYTSFANPATDSYSWNESLPNSRNAFITGDLAIYFGTASDLFRIRDSNPNLDFDIVDMPQLPAANRATFGRVYGLAVAKNSKNIPAALTFVYAFSGADYAGNIANALSLPPARRDLLAARPTGSYLPIFYSSALQAKNWFDPDPKRTKEIFKTMIADVVAGRTDAEDAVDDTSTDIGVLLNK
ncbi:hypothetical protein A2645_00760 [Candidatus Nomurabacteria bacterium RIFCSPHIGHO2_01_FULL_39_9]|uniref:Sugar ABC transporter substrate-binding protein n=1 Tax=Candidatus Nomurabacteria bacterium RIFCSPHIGHO2_01_FULL_39_9 TaxID=1801735 RepID=A0A1F6UVH9_9BACT|nr:MAG: hypothetical protein A2645_00760 [Candidatus Nomurabacteria bacterium RIFCSPHIGHO2_01_FULL_39_9]